MSPWALLPDAVQYRSRESSRSLQDRPLDGGWGERDAADGEHDAALMGTEGRAEGTKWRRNPREDGDEKLEVD